MSEPTTADVVYVGMLGSVEVGAHGTAEVDGPPLTVPADVAAELIARGDFQAATAAATKTSPPSKGKKTPLNDPAGDGPKE